MNLISIINNPERLTLISFCILLCFACTRDSQTDLFSICAEDKEITYLEDIKVIIDTKCANSGCHDAAYTASGTNYTTYDGLKSAIETEQFKYRVLVLKNMPNPNTVTAAKLLTDEELSLMRCWAHDGYLEQ